MRTTEQAAGVGPEKRYFDALKNDVFEIQRCDSCSAHVFYPRTICPHCGSDQLTWVAPSGRGTVYSTTTVRRKAEHGGDYNVSLIELDEGVRMMSRVETVSSSAVAIGMKVRAGIVDNGDARVVVFFPAEEN
jgi:uncharacterized OB-fold protein